MRRLVAAAAVTAALSVTGLLVSGCSQDATTTTDAAATPAVGASATASGAPAAGAAAGDAALSGNTAAICLQAQKTGGNAAANFSQDLKLLIDAESAKDPAQVANAKAKTTRDVENYGYALKDLSKLVDDPAVKKGLAEMSASVGKLKGDVRKFDAAELAKLQGTLAKACGTS
jgi:hypothetical protein